MISTIENMLRLVDEPHKTDCLNFIEKNKKLFESSKGSAIKHQAWIGGYRDHIREVMFIAFTTYEALERSMRKLPFTLSDALVGCFLHDVEKLWKHAIHAKDRKTISKDRLLQEEFHLTGDLWNAIHYAHGEGDDYHKTKLIQSPLAAFVHHADNTSARIWPGDPEGLTAHDRAVNEYEHIVEHYLDDLHDFTDEIKHRMKELERELDLETLVPAEKRIPALPHDPCASCGVRHDEHFGLDHEFFAIYRVGSWTSKEPE